MVTTAFFLERRNAVRPITMLKTIGPKKKEKIDMTSGLIVVGSKATTSRSLSRQRIARTKFSKMEYINGPVRITKMFVADGLFCREIDGLFCRSSPDIIVRRRCVLSHKRRGWLQPSPSFRYSRNLALQDELYHPVINNGPAVLVCVDKRLGTGPVNQSRDAG